MIAIADAVVGIAFGVQAIVAIVAMVLLSESRP